MAKPPTLSPFTQKSSALAAQHYDPETRTLTVEFSSGSRYAYHDVSHEKADAFIGSQSPGSFFAAKIRDVHKATKL